MDESGDYHASEIIQREKDKYMILLICKNQKI